MKTPFVSISHFGNALHGFPFLLIEKIFDLFSLPHLWSPSEEVVGRLALSYFCCCFFHANGVWCAAFSKKKANFPELSFLETSLQIGLGIFVVLSLKPTDGPGSSIVFLDLGKNTLATAIDNKLLSLFCWQNQPACEQVLLMDLRVIPFATHEVRGFYFFTPLGHGSRHQSG